MSQNEVVLAKLDEIGVQITNLDVAVRGDGKAVRGLVQRMEALERAMDSRPCDTHAEQIDKLLAGQWLARAIWGAAIFLGTLIGASGVKALLSLVLKTL